jgi:Lrp/AsnC family transcriptional regulator, regulator for asnA, asnC and gidA
MKRKPTVACATAPTRPILRLRADRSSTPDLRGTCSWGDAQVPLSSLRHHMNTDHANPSAENSLRGPSRYLAKPIDFAFERDFPPNGDSHLDDADLRIIDQLVRDGRTNSRAMVDAVGLTEETVGTRIRSLVDRGIIDITAIFDWYAAGYHWDFWVFVRCEPGPLDVTSQDLIALDEVISVQRVFGRVDLIAHVFCTDRSHMENFLSATLPRVSGIRDAEVLMSIDTVKRLQQFAWVPAKDEPLRFPNPVVSLDDLDYSIIAAVVRNGRTSNREISRDLGVSDATVRVRLRRLEDSGLLRIRAQVHPARSGMISARTWLGIEVQHLSAEQVAVALAQVPQAVTIAITSGRYHVFCYVLAQNQQRLLELVDEKVRSQPGVRSVEALPVIERTLKHGTHWARW